MHQNELCHRNLKPSSLYIGNSHESNNSVSIEKSKLIISDYGVHTAMKDSLQKTRVLHGSFDYHAPEVFVTKEFNHESDIWSIGTILLDITTTSLYDVNFNIILKNSKAFN